MVAHHEEIERPRELGAQPAGAGDFFTAREPESIFLAHPVHRAGVDRDVLDGHAYVPVRERVERFLHEREAVGCRLADGAVGLSENEQWTTLVPEAVRAAGFLAGKATDQILPLAMTRPESIYPLGRVTAPNLRKAQALLARRMGKTRLIDNMPVR